jgi:Flp pilus assembly pilin Flp
MKTQLPNSIPNSPDEKGATMVEYVFMVTLMSIACMASVGFMREGVHDKFQEVGTELGQGAIEQSTPPPL